MRIINIIVISRNYLPFAGAKRTKEDLSLILCPDMAVSHPRLIEMNGSATLVLTL
jgi:hypothetical protein